MPSKKDYEAVAGLLDSMRGDYDAVTLEAVADGLAEYFGQDNARFDRERFIEACGL